MDIKSKNARSANMSAIKSGGTRPEQLALKMFKKYGYRVKTSNRDLPGRPDIFLPNKKVAIFIHGCFWHRHPGCEYSYLPKSNVAFWKRKFESNISRDKNVSRQYRDNVIRQAVIWECEVERAVKEGDELTIIKRIRSIAGK